MTEPNGNLLGGLVATGLLWHFVLFLGALGVMLLVGGPVIAWLKGLPGTKWSAREDTPDTHLKKAGTPSMGGIGITGAATVTFGLTALAFSSFLRSQNAMLEPRAGAGDYWNFFLVLPLYTLAHMGLGLADDWSKATGNGGLRARDKFFGQLFLAVLFLIFALPPGGMQPNPSSLLMLGLFIVILVGVCNAVNITDGIDGLAAGLCVQVGLVLAYLGLETGFWWLALAGACLGFLVFNRFPARVFMGDTGSLALGAALAGAAMLSGAIWLLPFVGFIFFVELFSVTLQVLWFKFTRRKYGEGRRLFRRAPLHHHFELAGWSERRVVATFWTINLLTSMLGIWLWHAGVLPKFP